MPQKNIIGDSRIIKNTQQETQYAAESFDFL
jgi:hypothetical protein